MASASRAPLTKPLLECLLRIRNQPDLQPFLDYLTREKAFDMDVLASANDDRVMHLAQGAVRRITMIMELIENSPALLSRESGKTAGTSSSP